MKTPLKKSVAATKKSLGKTTGRKTTSRAGSKRKTHRSCSVRKPHTISVHLKGESLEAVKRIGKDFGIPLRSATSLALVMALAQDGLYLTPEEYEDAIKFVEERFSVGIDRSKIVPFCPPETDEAKRIAQETHDAWVAAKTKSAEASPGKDSGRKCSGNRVAKCRSKGAKRKR